MTQESSQMSAAIRKAAAQQALIDRATTADERIIGTIGLANGKLLPCPICGKSKWKSRVKNLVYVCRTCGYEREAETEPLGQTTAS